ncbi:MAG: HAMP domain-containing sensor histidine kinase [Sulfurimonadaceae bacterium]
MFSDRSIRSRFLVQLIIATVALMITFSSILYLFIQSSIYDEKRDEMITFAENICSYRSIVDAQESNNDAQLGLTVELIKRNAPQEQIELIETSDNAHTTLVLFYPFNLEDESYIKISKDISPTKKLLKKILNSIFIINAIGFLLVIVYAIIFSKMLISPIKGLNRRLSNMSEHMIRPIVVQELPDEFIPLGESINHLINRIQNFVKYQKELFIGAAHELKTPLAVMKLKNQVTTIKKRTPEEYIEAIKISNKSIDEMNLIVSSILNIGRQEGAQLETPIQADIIDILRRKANDFALLAESEGKELQMNFTPDAFMCTLQESLLNQIIQNLLQNALKFTPAGKKVLLQSHVNNEGLLIEVIDEGCGIDDTVDLFAPFKRQGSKSGAGLGLFLAKSASDALGGELSIKNRADDLGTVASLLLRSKLHCILPLK